VRECCRVLGTGCVPELTRVWVHRYIVLTGTVELSANHPQSRSELELELGKAGPGHTVGCVDIFHVRFAPGCV